jgi:hypothetical protein
MIRFTMTMDIIPQERCRALVFGPVTSFARLMAAILLVVLLFAASPIVFAQTTNSDGDQAKISRLLKEVELRKFIPPERDTNGNVVTLLLDSHLADDQGIEAASKIHSLRELRIQPSAVDKIPTKAAISHLLGMTNLESLGLGCGGTLNPGVFAEICQIRGLRKLSLVSTRPPAEETYSAITNLQNLTAFSISYCPNFGDRELCLLTNLHNLRSLDIYRSGITSEGMKVLRQMNDLTNVKVFPSK